ncbi:tumor protein p53-inducible nuclear protein 1 [Corythoichthys intestinalis]|uniref:tumor protein p53-inducible nuclear protein 1 n=1 Tax=Corythoichthys intestinalis TaxID=161448 RepID=UPI0025A54D76|nr:tumor protein p53-inducible nuclear protein 1 [Corythoichthys intestinalis]XP_057690086.1 tumor protein p53-inducible nuclear protein 1 [Corythoichthys intestinalis]XP_061789030.1 tumor protein p53-inducible nuclear protein 1-like [Nerophis lumbriciformis]
MFQRFASALFGDDDVAPQPSRLRRHEKQPEEEEDEEDWILVNFLADSCSGQRCGDGLSGAVVGKDVEEEEDEDLVIIPSPVASPPVRYASCTSLNSTADTDPDGGGEEDEEEDGDFLRVDAASLEESWFVTPPPCFTGRGVRSVLVETSPLENLLIEHPSMSVYAHHSPPRLNLDPMPRSMDLELATAPKEKGRRSLDSSRHRPEVSSVQRRTSLHQSACYAAALSARAGLLPPRPGLGAGQPLLSRNALRRLNLLHPPKAGPAHLHQPSQRHLNF